MFYRLWTFDVHFTHFAHGHIRVYGYATLSNDRVDTIIWTLTKRLEKKLDGNYTRMLRAILNRSWRQHPTKQQLYGHLPPITKTIQIRRTRHAGHYWRSRDELISGPLHMAERKQGDQLEPKYSSSVRIRSVTLRTCRKLWTIERGGEKGSGISVLMARHDDDDFKYIVLIKIL